MKVVDSIDTAAKAKALTESERDDFFTKMVTGKDVTEEIETSRGKFVVKYPKPKDMIAIGRIAAYRRNYKPVNSFDAMTEVDIITTSTLDVVVVSGPDWYERAKQADENFSFLEVPSRAFINELYGKAYSFRGEVDKRLDQDEGAADTGVPAEPDVDDAVDSGAFGGLSSK